MSIKVYQLVLFVIKWLIKPFFNFCLCERFALFKFLFFTSYFIWLFAVLPFGTLKVPKIQNTVKFIFIQILHFLPYKNVEISTFVKFYQCIFIEYACIKSLYTKYIGKIWKIFGHFYHILPLKNPYISRLPAILGVMFFWYMELYIIFIKKIFIHNHA